MKQSMINLLRDNLPLSVKQKVPRFLIELFDKTSPVAPPENIQIISTLDALDIKLKELDRAAQVSDDALRQQFQTFRMDFHLDNPSDP